jgi:hypothetical protein
MRLSVIAALNPLVPENEEGGQRGQDRSSPLVSCHDLLPNPAPFHPEDGKGPPPTPDVRAPALWA